MKLEILNYLQEQVSEGEQLLKGSRSQGERDTIQGYLQACDEFREFVEEFDDEVE